MGCTAIRLPALRAAGALPCALRAEHLHGLTGTGMPATTNVTVSHRAARARLVVPRASVKARPDGVAGTTESPTSGLIRTNVAKHPPTAAARPSPSRCGASVIADATHVPTSSTSRV